MSEVPARPVHGTPCWVSLLVRDLPAAERFYGALFGWEFRPGPQRLGPYTRAVLGGREVAGMAQIPRDRRMPVSWTVYLAGDDADATAERVREAGGTVAVGPIEVDSAGRMAIASDPAGAVFGIWEPHERVGTDLAPEPGRLVWNELITRDPSWIDTFYIAVFGYTTEQVPSPFESRMLLCLKDRPVAGISGVGDRLPRTRPPYWMSYFSVSDADATAARVRDLGGSVLREPRDSPYGRQVVLADPEGARFAVVQGPEPLAEPDPLPPPGA
ncbi:VOC family protein [Streptomyces capparidis]